MSSVEFGAGDVERLLAGDASASQAFAQRFSRLLRMKVQMRNGAASASYVEDVVQETLARVLTALREGRVQDPDRIGAFVSRTGDFVLSESHRARRRFRPLDEANDPHASDDPERDLAVREQAEVARELIGELPERDQKILRALFAEAIDKDEVCRRFGIDRGHLRVLVCRAKDRLRDLLETHTGQKLSHERG